MFFTGASLSVDVLKNVGVKPLIQGVLLWVVISLSTLAYIFQYIDRKRSTGKEHRNSQRFACNSIDSCS